MRSFRGTMIISKECSQTSILSASLCIFLTLKSAVILFCSRTFSVYFRAPVTVKQTSYQSSYIFRAAFPVDKERKLNVYKTFNLRPVSIGLIILKWEQPLEEASFSQKDFFRTPSCLEELFLSNSYILVTNTFSDQLLLEYKYFFSTATVMFRRSYFLRISN